MALVNFYNRTPSYAQVASELNNDELVVFDHMTTGARVLTDQVEAQVDFKFSTHHENTIPKWNGVDYFVMVSHSCDYPAMQEKLRVLTAEWIAVGRPDQVKYI